MNVADLIGTIGASMMLLAYIINMSDKISNDNIIYLFLNIFGGALAAFGSYLVEFYPLAFLEGIWSLLSIGSLLKNLIYLGKYK